MRIFLKITGFLILAAIILGGGIGTYFWYIWSSNLPYVGSVMEFRPPIITEVYPDDDHEVIGRFWEEKRIVVPLESLPENLIHAFVAAEDARFFEHEGVDIKSIMRAFLKNLRAGKIEQGGSTITQQIVKSLFLKNTERTYRRKVREAILSVQIEKNLSKEQILFLYLNQIYLGQGAYGVEAAAETYFGKSATDLTLAESALLAGLPQAPAKYSPVSHFERAKARQKYVLERMMTEGYITEKQRQEAFLVLLDIKPKMKSAFYKTPYFTEHVRRYLLKGYGREPLYRGGLRVYTTLDLKMQQAAQEALSKGLHELDKREGYRGPIKHLAENEIPEYKKALSEGLVSNAPHAGLIVEGIVTRVNDKKKMVHVSIGEDMTCLLKLAEMKWARKPDPKVASHAVSLREPSKALSPGDLILVRLIKEAKKPFAWEVALEQEPEVQGALFCMDPRTGEVKAMVGGRDFTVSEFDRATQSKRQPGSAFKPIIYSAAIDWGMSPAEVLIDAPFISDQNPDEETWKPKNYKERFFGPTIFRTALAKSRNVITVKILKRIGVEYAIQYARKMGIVSPMSPDLSLALGSSGLSLVEITTGYAVFANGGMLVKPIFIHRVVDRNSQVIEENQPVMEEVISKETAYVMTDLLRAVVTEGTGWRVRALGRPTAGKTGTTNDLRDAWFMGYTPELVTGVWVGYDDRREMGRGETGSRSASPIWLYFMSKVLEGKPVADFQVPEGVVFAKIDAKTGFLASPYSQKTVLQAFKEGTDPQEYSPKPKTAKSGQFFQFDMDY